MKRKHRNGKHKNGNKKTRRFNFTLTHGNWHHVYPTSRRLKGTNKFEIHKDSMVEHNVWHWVFGVLFPEEAIEKIQESVDLNGEVDIGLITHKIEWWWILFRDLTLAVDIIAVIKKNWTYPGVELVRDSKGWWVIKEN
ncbi:MAG: hypothetical protein HYW34_01630 [Candidatus Brennerbacteria bacterium]|nr:hypothetical protein [Candidatus Brennerbacteria bacterium]